MGSEFVFKPVSKDLLYVKIAGEIQRYIQKNNLQVGDRLPSERDLAEQFGTSRHSVREALRVLEGEGIIEVKSAKGIFIAGSQNHPSVYIELIKINYRELLSIKGALEKLAIQSAVEQGKPEEFDRVEELMRGIEEEAARGIYAEELDKKFHHEIARLSKNKTLQQMIEKIIAVFDDYNHELDQTEEMRLQTVPAHREMLDAIKRKDVAAAVRAYDQIGDLNNEHLEACRTSETDG